MLNHKIAAVIIAAGYSSRMGAFKPLLPLGDQTVIDVTISLFHSIGIHDIYVVTGYQSDLLEHHLKNKHVTCLYNANFDQGMFSSIVTGIKALPAEVDAFFMLPADIPMVTKETLLTLLDAYASNQCKIVYPSMDMKKGHPPLISSELFSDIIKYDGTNGLKGILKKFNSTAVFVSVTDPGILMDMDTPEAYNKLKSLYEDVSK